ncbi:MAG: hypothetical protein ACYTEV_03530 [Planctomycetota bacterium]|jgi:hypothetical protein
MATLTPPARSRRTARSPRSPLALLAAVLISLLLPAAPAEAQRVREIFPDPLSGRDLDEIGRRIGMSEFQRLSIDPAHVQYLDGYRDLRERELEPFLGDLLTQGRTFFFNPDPELVREFLRRLERAERKIAGLDEELFASMDQVLTAEQRMMMPKVRTRRELDRLNSGFIRGLGSGIPATTTDYGRIIERLDLSPADRQRMEPLVFDYENRVANARRRVREQGERVLVELVTEASRLLQQVLAGGEINPEAANVWIQLRQTAYEKVKPVMGDLVDLARINRDILDQWGPLLPPDIAEQLRTIHYQYGYGEALGPFIRVRDRHDRALRLPSLPAAQRPQIEAMRADLVDRAFRLVERMEREAFDAIRAATFIIEDERAEEIQALSRRYEELEALCESADAALAGLLGEEQFALLGRPEDEGGPTPAGPDPAAMLLKAPETRLLARQPDVAALEIPDAEFEASGPFIAGGISDRELTWFAAILQLDETQREMLEATRLDHLDAYERFDREHAAALRGLIGRLNAESGDADVAAELAAAWLAADEALEQHDAAFFADVELIVLDPADPAEAEAMAAVREARERVRLAVGRGRDLGGWAGRMAASIDAGGGFEHAIDLDLLLAESSGESADATTAAMPMLVEYARTRLETLRTYREAWRRYAGVVASMSATPAEDRRNGEFWQRMNEPRAAVADARRQLVQLNRRTLSRLERAADSIGATLRDRYQRAAFPKVYDDEQSAEGPLLAALNLPDLGPDQADRVRDLIALYRPRHQDLCRALVEERMAESMARGGRREWQERTARSNRIEQHVFDREELNARTLRALRSVLADEQARAVGFAVSRS